MNGLPYYKRYPRDFIEGTVGMPLELKGAYSLVLDLIYMQNGKLPDDARYISGLLGCTIRKWKSLRNQLLSIGKVYVNGEFLSNYRADNLLETQRSYQLNQAEKGRTSNKNNDLTKTTVKPARDYTEPDTDTDTEESKKETRASALDGFEEFWDVYAFKKARPKCEAIWKRKRLNLIAEKVIAGARTYAATRSPDPGFWKYPEGWLTAERWNDEVPAPKRDVFMDWINSKGNDDADERSDNSNCIDAEIIPRLGKAH